MRHTFITWLLNVKHPDEHVQRRGQMTILVACGLVMTVLGSLGLVLGFADDPIEGLMSLIVSTTIFFVTIALTQHGWVNLGAWLLVGICILGVMFPMFTGRVVSIIPFFLVFAIVIGGLVLKPWQIWVVLALILLGLLGVVAWIPNEIQNQSTEILSLIGSTIMLVTVTIISFLAAYRIDTSITSLAQARQDAQAATQALTAANANLETRVAARTTELRTALAEVEQRAAVQAQLLAENEQQRITIRDLLVPILPVSDTTLVIPLVGALDSARLQDLQRHALQRLEQTPARQLLLDLTGVSLVDTQVAQGLIRVAQSAQLLGVEVVLIGLRPEVAQTIVALGIDISHIRTFQSLQTALRYA